MTGKAIFQALGFSETQWLARKNLGLAIGATRPYLARFRVREHFVSEQRARVRSALGRLFSAAISQAIDPPPIRFTARDVVRGQIVARGCRRSRGGTLKLRTAIPRNSFLAGCFELTNDEPREHLIVGFGTRRMNSTLVERVVHRLGDPGNVSFPPELQAEIARYVLSGHAQEVLVFHNHPLNALNVLVDNEPWASPQDRHIAISQMHDLRMWIKIATEGGRVRFYLAENGYVREFVGPDFLSMLASSPLRA